MRDPGVSKASIHLSPPAVSVIIPAHNTAPFVADSVRSVLSQTVQDLEVIAVDDGSTDETAAILHRLSSEEPRVRVLTNSPSQGVSAARNLAIRSARGRYVALLDSDDLWLPEFLATQLAAFDRFPDAGVVTGNARQWGGAFDGRPYRQGYGAASRVSLLDMIEREDTICIMSVFRREVFDAVKGFDEALRHNEDYDFWLRAALVGFEFVQTPEPLGLYRRRSDSASAEEQKMLAGIVPVLARTRLACAHRAAERDAIDRQIARFERRRLFVDATAALRDRNFRVVAERFQSLYEKEGGLKLALVAAASRRAPQSLWWLDRLRSAVRRTWLASPAQQRRVERVSPWRRHQYTVPAARFN